MQLRILSLILIILSSCSSPEPEVLYKIPRDEIVTLIKHNKLNYAYAKFVNQDRTELSDATRKQLNLGKLGMDYYMDKKGIIREVRVRHIELADKIVEIQKRELSYNPLSKIELIDIDCEKLDSIYSSVDESIKESRKSAKNRNLFHHTYAYREEVDSISQQMIVSTISKCGYSEEHFSTLLLVLRYGPTSLLAYYYADLKAFSNQDKLSKSKIAYLEDRLLRYHGYPQIYGSQIQHGRLYKLEDPAYVNERRARMDLEPIEAYLQEWDLNFEEEVERMSR